MKSQSIRVSLLAALSFTSPTLTFAGGQPAKERNTTSTRYLSEVSRAVQQGKGSGMTRAQGVPADAYRVEKAGEPAAKSSAVRPNPGDSTFRK
jgi:hypothetical protein